jgi:hypothetical protein
MGWQTLLTGHHVTDACQLALAAAVFSQWKISTTHKISRCIPDESNNRCNLAELFLQLQKWFNR